MLLACKHLDVLSHTHHRPGAIEDTLYVFLYPLPSRLLARLDQL